MNDPNEKLRKLAHLRGIKRLELEFLLHFGLPIHLPTDERKEATYEQT